MAVAAFVSYESYPISMTHSIPFLQRLDDKPANQADTDNVVKQGLTPALVKGNAAMSAGASQASVCEYKCSEMLSALAP
jgi:hypothetical protein